MHLLRNHELFSFLSIGQFHLTDFLSLCHVGPVSNIFKFLVQIFLLSWPQLGHWDREWDTSQFYHISTRKFTKLKLFLTKKELKELEVEEF